MERREIDLNLLVFRELIGVRQISAAAKRLRLMPSGVSNAQQPASYAEQMAEPAPAVPASQMQQKF